MTNQDIDQFIDKLKRKRGFVVRVKGNKANPPKALSYRNSGVSYAPHLIVERGNASDLYEFEKTYAPSKLHELIGKWILFSIQAKTLSGYFYLVVRTEDHLKFEKVINEKLLDIELIVIRQE